MLWDDDMGWEIEEDLDWEDREALEEYRYWLDWADGVLNQDPEPGEASEAEAEVDLLPGPELPEEVLEALAEAPLAYGWSLTEALQELEQEAGMFLEGRVRVKLHLLRLLLGLLPLAEDEPLLKLRVREDAASEPRLVPLTKGDLRRVVEGWLELYALDFPSQAYEEMKAFRRFLERSLWEKHPALAPLLLVCTALWDHLEALHDPDLDLPPWAPALVREALKRRKRALKRRFGPNHLAAFGLTQSLEESDDLYELVALEAFLGLAEGE